MFVQGIDGGEGRGGLRQGEGRRSLGDAHGDGGEGQAGQAGIQRLRHGLADGAEAGDADAVAVHKGPEGLGEGLRRTAGDSEASAPITAQGCRPL
ncbi:hypothetical protein G6F63_015997 [Rhizopus arrhizus]|nr:hypothetical protein G6F63_015997 [Rhizopus arrhizus]